MDLGTAEVMLVLQLTKQPTHPNLYLSYHQRSGSVCDVRHMNKPSHKLNTAVY